MTAITKGAIKAVKFYKHVVQSVEKFLQKVPLTGCLNCQIVRCHFSCLIYYLVPA